MLSTRRPSASVTQAPWAPSIGCSVLNRPSSRVVWSSFSSLRFTLLVNMARLPSARQSPSLSLRLRRRPRENDLARTTRPHDLERFFVAGDREMVRDDRSDVQAALDHGRHLVPGLEHLAAIDALDGQPAEDHGLPVHRRLPFDETEQADAAPMAHGCDHAVQRPRAAGHLEADIELLLHA